MRSSRSRSTAAIIVGACIVTACSGGGGPASLPSTTSPSAISRDGAMTQPLHRFKHERDALGANVCTTSPVKGLQVTPTSLTLAPKGSTSFTACTQYETTFSIAVSSPGVLT